MAVGAPNECEYSSTVAKGSFVDGETLFFPVVGFDDAVADGLFEKVDRVLVVDRGARIPAGVKEAFGVCLVRHHERRIGSVWYGRVLLWCSAKAISYTGVICIPIPSYDEVLAATFPRFGTGRAACGCAIYHT